MSEQTQTIADSIELATGQPVPWPHAPGGIAQVDELLRRNVILFYRASTGRVRRPRASARLVAELLRDSHREQPLLPMHNPLARGVRRRVKTFNLG